MLFTLQRHDTYCFLREMMTLQHEYRYKMAQCDLKLVTPSFVNRIFTTVTQSLNFKNNKEAKNQKQAKPTKIVKNVQVQKKEEILTVIEQSRLFSLSNEK